MFPPSGNETKDTGLPVKANSGRTSRSRSSGFALESTASARFRLLSTSPT